MHRSYFTFMEEHSRVDAVMKNILMVPHMLKKELFLLHLTTV